MNTPTAIETKKEVKAPQAVVHIKHSITLRQYKIWLAILQKYRDFYEAGEQYDEDGFYRLPKAELDELIGYETTKADIRRDLIALRKEDIIISILEKGGEKAEEGMGFISRWRLTSKTIAIELPPFLKNVMKGLDQPRAMFQLLNWQIFNHFSGKYEAVIYKLCRDYVGAKNTPYMTVQEFREYMGLKSSEYPEFKNLNYFVIKKPVEQINESPVSDIFIKEIHFKKSGRNVVGFYFEVARKTQTSIDFPELEQNEAFRFAKVHIETFTQMEYLALRKPEEIELCIERANEYGEGETAKGKEPNYGALYRKAINEGWHASYADKKAKKEAIEQVKRREKQQAQEAVKSEEQEVKKQAEGIKRALDLFAERPIEEQESIKIAFFESLSENSQQLFERGGRDVSKPLFRAKFRDFFKINYLENE